MLVRYVSKHIYFSWTAMAGLFCHLAHDYVVFSNIDFNVQMRFNATQQTRYIEPMLI